MLLVRFAEDRDFEAIAAIYAHYVLHGLATFEEAPPTADEMRARCQAVRDAGLPYLVAELDGWVAGYSYATGYRPRPAYRFTVEDSVYVAQDAAGKGLGSALLAALIERCEAGPWRQMLAVIGNSGSAGSIALHRRFGFAAIGTLPAVGFKLGQWVDTVLMQRALGNGDATLPVTCDQADSEKNLNRRNFKRTHTWQSAVSPCGPVPGRNRSSARIVPSIEARPMMRAAAASVPLASQSVMALKVSSMLIE